MTDPIVRAEGYLLLARCMHTRTGPHLRDDLADAAQDPGLDVLASLAAAWDEAVPEEHVRLFGGATPVSPYETGHVRVVTGPHLGQLAALYELFGARVGGPEHDRVDHVGTELEFAALLSLKEGLLERTGNADGAERCREGRRALLEDHLGRFASAFAARLGAVAVHPFFVRYAAVVRDFVARDCAEHGWEPAAASSGPAEPEGELVCPVAGPALG